MSKIILTADDFGACDYIDSGIMQALKNGRINSVAAFVCFPDSQKRIADLIKFKRDHSLDFAIGLHFSITAGFPLTPTNSLAYTDERGRRTFYLPGDFFERGHNERADIAPELSKQIETLQDILSHSGYDVASKTIDSVSNHHGAIYIDTRLFKTYIDVIDNYKIPIRSPRPWSRTKLGKRDQDGVRMTNPAIREGIELGFMKRWWGAPFNGRRVRIARNNGLVMPFCLLDEFYGQPDKGYLEFLLNEFNGKSFSSEFMFHLGDASKKPNASAAADLPGINFDYFEMREKELNELNAADLPQLLAQNKIQLATFRELQFEDSFNPKYEKE